VKRLFACVVLGALILAGLLLLSACGTAAPSTTVNPGGSTTSASSTTTEAPTTTTTAASSTTTTLAEIIPWVPTLRYANDKHGFSVDRPKTSTLATAGFEAYLPLTQTPVVAIVLPPSLFKGTNLGEAGVYIGASSAAAVTSKWKVPVSGSAEVAAGTTTVNGATFAVFTSTEPAAGNIYEERVYRTVHEGTCFELTELLHSGNIGNYTPGTVEQFDKVKFGGYLEAIVESFVFE
jgi:hypothetical protein